MLCFALKAGLEASMDNWRLLSVHARMGLLQEGVLANRLRPSVLQEACASEWVSPYQRGVGDAWLVLFELSSAYRAAGRCLFLIMEDFVKAFPSVWREDLLGIKGRFAFVWEYA